MDRSKPPKPREWFLMRKGQTILSNDYEVRFYGKPPSDSKDFAEVIHVREVLPETK